MRTKLGLALTALLVLSACGSGAKNDAATAASSGSDSAGSSGTLRINQYNWVMQDLGVLVADRKGFFRERGLTMEFRTFENAPAALAALHAGDLDVVSTPPLLQTIAAANNKKSTSTVVSVFAPEEHGSWSLLAGPKTAVDTNGATATRVRALKGKKVGVPAIGSEGQLITNALFTHAGLNPKTDYTPIAVGLGPSALAQLKAGRIDAIAAVSPTIEVLIAEAGAKTIFDQTVDRDVPSIDPWMLTTYYAAPAVADAKRKHFQAFQEAMGESVMFLKDPNNLDEVTKIWAAEQPNRTVEFLKPIVAKYATVLTTDVTCAAFDNPTKLAIDSGSIPADAGRTCRETLWVGSRQPVAK